MAVNTKNHYLTWLRAILRYGSELDWYSLSVVPRIKLNHKDANQRFRVTTSVEINKLLLNSPEHIRTTIMIAIYTGMRQGEIFNLKWNQIDFTDGLIYLTPKDVKEGYPRWIPLIPELESLLKNLPRDLEYVIHYKKKHIKRISTAWKTLLHKTSIEDLKFHDLRHCARRFLRQAGIKPEVIASILGHHDLKMSMRYDSIYGDDFETAKKLCTKILGKSRFF